MQRVKISTILIVFKHSVHSINHNYPSCLSENAVKETYASRNYEIVPRGLRDP